MIRITSDLFGTEAPTFADTDELRAHIEFCATELGWYDEYRSATLEQMGDEPAVEGEDYMSTDQWKHDMFLKAMRESESL